MYPSLELKYETRCDDVLLIAMSNNVGGNQCERYGNACPDGI